MLAQLVVPYVDTRAAGLSWWLGDAPAPLAVLRVDDSAGSVELRLLGASHQVVAAAGSARIAEVVACRPGAAAPLPGATARRVDGADYRFTSRTSAYDEAGLRRVARRLRSRHEPDPRSIVGAFPGSPDALTVLTARPLDRGWAWRSWHVYPVAGEVVRTTGSFRTAR